MKTLHEIIANDDRFSSFSWSVSTIQRILMSLGFRFLANNQIESALLIENEHLVRWRINYCEKYEQYVQENRPIYKIDESYVNLNHVNRKLIHDTTIKSAAEAKANNLSTGFKRSNSPGQRLIMVGIGSKQGWHNYEVWIRDCTSDDYHDNMDYENFVKFLKEKILPTLPPGSVLIIDNAAYHSKTLDKIPKWESSIKDMKKFLTTHNIEFREKAYKEELFAIISKFLEENPDKHYCIDAIVKEYGHIILRLPPYHPELNGIEKI